jgi:hypothetical protein
VAALCQIIRYLERADQTAFVHKTRREPQATCLFQASISQLVDRTPLQSLPTTSNIAQFVRQTFSPKPDKPEPKAYHNLPPRVCGAFGAQLSLSRLG